MSKKKIKQKSNHANHLTTMKKNSCDLQKKGSTFFECINRLKKGFFNKHTFQKNGTKNKKVFAACVGHFMLCQ